jgi:hypothetical protein
MYRAVYMGDYRVRHSGDFLGIGGAFKKIGGAVGGLLKGAGKIAGIAGTVLPGPIGAAAKVAGNVLSGKKGGAYAAGAALGTGAVALAGGLPVLKMGGLQINPGNFLPGGQPLIGVACPSGRYNQDGSCRKRPTMNPANPRALRRAIRRQAGFIKLARRALKGSGYVIATRGRSRKIARRR